jgi:DNA-binding LacI/PurR family transcriptional regulator
MATSATKLSSAPGRGGPSWLKDISPASGSTLRALPIIGFVPSEIQNPLFARIAHDLDVVVHSRSYNLLIAGSEDNSAQERQVLAGLRALNPQGLILVPARTDG